MLYWLFFLNSSNEERLRFKFFNANTVSRLYCVKRPYQFFPFYKRVLILMVFQPLIFMLFKIFDFYFKRHEYSPPFNLIAFIEYYWTHQTSSFSTPVSRHSFLFRRLKTAAARNNPSAACKIFPLSREG